MKRSATGPLVFLSLAIWSTVAAGSPAAPKSISLNGDWNFVADPSGSLDVQKLATAQYVRPTRVPSSWQSQFADLRDYAGIAWYWRSFTLESPPTDHVVLLRFGAVDYRAEVYVNSQKAGEHEGGYLPFEFDVTSFVRAGENQVAVRVVDPGKTPDEVEGIRYKEIPHGKQDWYVQTSGLWQDVELDIRPRTRLGNVHVTAGASGTFKIVVPVVRDESAGRPQSGLELRLEMRDPAGRVVWEQKRELSGAESVAEFSGQLSQPNLWSLSNPALYTLGASLSSGDDQATRFGFRTFEARAGKFYLNGKVIYLRGALDQDFYPDTVYTPPSFDFLLDEMRKAKALGLNLLRCHIKVPDPRYLQAADEAGVLIWYEIPNWDKLTEDSKRRAVVTLRGMAERDWNHPSIVIVSIINESWGANLKEGPDRAWLKEAYQEAKRLGPGWLVVDNSACCDDFHVVSDIADFHQYSAIPDYAANFDRLVEDQARRGGWLFSPYGDAVQRGDEPLVLSEFGNWGLPYVPDPKPWWFGRDFRGNKMTLPDGVENRFADYQYGSLFSDLRALSEATEWHQYRALKYQIESLRARPEFQGYVISEFTDINWESNGLLDMWRQPKVYGELLSRLQQDDLLILRAEKRNFATGDKVQASVHFSHYRGDTLNGAVVSWQMEGATLNGSFPLPTVPLGSAARVGTIEFAAPRADRPLKTNLKVQLAAGGKTVAENSLELFFYPPKDPELPPPVSFRDPAGRLRRLVNEMRARNYQAPTGSEAFAVLIASTFDDEVKKTLRAGGRVILIASDRQTLAPGLEIVPRAGSNLDGNWISSFPWLRKGKEPFKSVGFDTFAGFETQAVTPSAVIQGVPPENFSDVLAGMFYGWLHSNVGTLLQAKCGRGKLLVTTFSLATTYATDPYATTLLDGLVNYAVMGPVPRFEIPLP